MESDSKKKDSCENWWCCCPGGRGGFGFGIFLLIVGLFFLAKDLGWIDSGFSFWTVFFIAFGIYFLVGKKHSRK